MYELLLKASTEGIRQCVQDISEMYEAANLGTLLPANGSGRGSAFCYAKTASGDNSGFYKSCCRARQFLTAGAFHRR